MEDFKKIQEYSWNLHNVKKQTDELCLEAVKLNGLVLKIVENKTFDICLVAIKQNGYAIEYVPDIFINEELCLEAVKSNGNSLGFCKYKTKEICTEAVKNKGTAICYVPNEFIDNELCLIAVKHNKYNGLEYIANEFQTEKICIESVKNNLESIIFVKNITKNLFLEVFKTNKNIALYHTNDLFENNEGLEEIINFKNSQLKYFTQQQCIDAIKKDYSNILFCKIINNNIISEMLTKNGCSLKYIIKQKPEFIDLAIKNNRNSKRYVRI